MPFTFSHPAIVLPFIALRQRWRSSTGLIIGSMVPDFEKFLRVSFHDPYSHTWRSIFYFNLPLGLLLCFAFHLLVRDPLIDHLPYFLRQRFNRFKRFYWKPYFKRHYGVILLSLLVGIVSHLTWDSFTHQGGLGVRLFPFLQEEILPKKRLYMILQQVLSLAGGLCMLVFILLLPKEVVPPQKSIWGYWLIVALFTIAMVAFRVLTGGFIHNPELVIAPISGGLLGLVLTSVWYKIRQQPANKY